MRNRVFFHLVFGISPLFVSAVGAQEISPTVEQAEATPIAEKKVEKLKPGVLASSGKFSVRGKATSQTLDENTPGETASPIGGSVKRISSNKCAAVIINSSEKKGYSVSYDVVKTSTTGSSSGAKKSFSSTVGPKQTVEREFACQATDNFQLVLKSGRSIEK